MGIQHEINDGIGHIQLDRPEKANAYDRAHLLALRAAFSAVTRSSSVVIISSTSPRVFCAGADLDEMTPATPDDARNLLSQAVSTEIARAEVVTIAVVDGPAVAGGFELALAADLRVIGPGARFRLPEVSLGIIPAAGGSTRLTSLLGPAIAKQVILGGVEISADEAIRWGLGRAGGANPAEVAWSWAEQLKACSPEARRSAKRIIDTVAEDASLLAERHAQAKLYGQR